MADDVLLGAADVDDDDDDVGEGDTARVRTTGIVVAIGMLRLPEWMVVVNVAKVVV